MRFSNLDFTPTHVTDVETINQVKLSVPQLIFCNWYKQYFLPGVLLPGESQQRGSLVGCRLWGRTESDTTEVTQQQQKQHLHAGLLIQTQNTVRTLHGTTDWFKTGKGVWQGCILLSCLFNFHEEYIMQNTKLGEPQVGITMARRNINNLRYANDATQASCPLSCPSPPAFSFSQHPGLFYWVSSSH